jgi:hypothetical protein
MRGIGRYDWRAQHLPEQQADDAVHAVAPRIDHTTHTGVEEVLGVSEVRKFARPNITERTVKKHATARV